MKIKVVKKSPAPIGAEQVKSEFNHRWWKSSAEADKLLAVLVKKHQEDMARFLPESPKVCREDAIDSEQVKGKALVYESDMRIAVAYLNELFSKHQNNTLFEHMEDEALSSFIAVVLNAVQARKNKPTPIEAERVRKPITSAELKEKWNEFISRYSES